MDSGCFHTSLARRLKQTQMTLQWRQQNPNLWCQLQTWTETSSNIIYSLKTKQLNHSVLWWWIICDFSMASKDKPLLHLITFRGAILYVISANICAGIILQPWWRICASAWESDCSECEEKNRCVVLLIPTLVFNQCRIKEWAWPQKRHKNCPSLILRHKAYIFLIVHLFNSCKQSFCGSLWQKRRPVFEANCGC